MAMGSPLSAILCELVLDDIFISAKDHFKNNIKFMTKYVDDSLVIMKDHIFDDFSKFLIILMNVSILLMRKIRTLLFS